MLSVMITGGLLARFAFVALSLGCLPRAFSQERTVETFIDLLPSIDPAKDAVAGVWTMSKGGLSSSGSGQERIEIPYQPPAEYDFRVTFTKLSGNNCVIQLLAHGEDPFIWVMSTDGMFTFHYLKGAGIGNNRTTVQKRTGIKARSRYVSLVRVRKDGAEALLDGKPMSKWPTDYTDVVVAPFWLLRDKRLLGLAAADAKTVFQKVEVKEVSGAGKFTR